LTYAPIRATAKHALFKRQENPKLAEYVMAWLLPVPNPPEPYPAFAFEGPVPRGLLTLFPVQEVVPSRVKMAMAMKAPHKRTSRTMARKAKKDFPPRQQVKTMAKIV
jgi:hypothetical protein